MDDRLIKSFGVDFYILQVSCFGGKDYGFKMFFIAGERKNRETKKVCKFMLNVFPIDGILKLC